MTEDELFDVLTDIEETIPQSAKATRFEEAAADLTVGEHGWASLLLAAGEHWQLRGEYAEAKRCFHAAIADAGEPVADALADLHGLALAEGQDDEAMGHAETLRRLARDGDISVTACHHVGESLEARGELRQAHRWFTMPLTWVEDLDAVTTDEYFCLTSRLRVRRALGLPEDRVDQIAVDALAVQRARA